MVNYFTNIYKTKAGLNSDGQLVHQYQQIKTKLKQWWSTIPPISTNQTTTTHFNSMHTKRRMGNMTYDIGNPGFGLGQAQQCLSNCY
jgi:hypothetical protein